MRMTTTDMLRCLGEGRPIDAVCKEAEIERAEFDAWWSEETKRRLTAQAGTLSAAVSDEVQIQRDARGIPHIFAANKHDLFAGFGWAMAGDRLFQLDYLRRKGAGRLAEILGERAVELDLIARTIGFRRIAEAEWAQLPAETRELLTAFAAGINAHIETVADNPPIEFDLLGYRPEPWTEIDCLTIEVEFRWYLTGRFPVIAIPELVKRQLGEGPLYEEFLLGEEDDEAILPRGSYPATAGGLEPVGAAMGSPFEAHGSNNWVLAGSKTVSGKPLVASDPHIAFEAVSCWYEAHLCGGGFNTAGMSYVGMPAIMFGRNEQVAWGATNNICSQRDLYLEQTDEQHPGAFLFDGQWETALEIEETIEIKNAEPLRKTIRFTRNGSLVDEVLPPAARATGPVSIRWLGRHAGGWLTALLGMNRAGSVDDLIAATEPWHVPTFCIVAADNQGNIGYKATGRIPQRSNVERGYRPGWDPGQQWTGLLPFEQMPHWVNPDRGWIATANNRVAADDFPYPLYGTWNSGHRARRIREIIESRAQLSTDDCAEMHQDSLSLRAVACVPKIVALLEGQTDESLQNARTILREWNCRCEPGEVGPALFNVFFENWCRAVTTEHFEGEAAELVAMTAGGISSRLLESDPHGWFQHHQREEVFLDTMRNTVSQLTDEYGPEMSRWTWGRRHRMPLNHVLGQIGDLGQLLNHGGGAVPGDMTTVGNTGYGPGGSATTGGGYRLIADMSQSPPTLLAQDAQSQSGQPASPHYDDQLDDWLNRHYHSLPLDPGLVEKNALATLVLKPE